MQQQYTVSDQYIKNYAFWLCNFGFHYFIAGMIWFGLETVIQVRMYP